VNFKFEIKKSINVILFALKSLGGRYDMYRLFSILYLADVKHLATYGFPILGDSFVALKNGPIPFNAYTIYKQLKGESYLDNISANIRKFLTVNENGDLIANEIYDESYLAPTEAYCIFETIMQYKNANTEQMKDIVSDLSWQLSNYDGRISLNDIISIGNIPEDMVTYIRAVLNNESQLLNEKIPTRPEAKGETVAARR
jgi:hypothetical protein